ncbi:hypothetical protein SAMN05444374_11783 [Rhodococcoides kroppenstedtii]|uniref:Uncharacterized protein n=1 Tax=Rhodococcoides kroppenstedtii TaxID=293050 RepID=A0A1I0UC69_9NOCA|nr:hypothetical protein [Rhodococcus kroppenstedtii]MBT1192660.1 hypothetical protein [Rhodococcus kroppenstedtii]MBY6436126.1 hypothetical protein [Rhodococcus kroppenstedtii]SFA61397.1 hypothetical protein SAMN05444374_11783 [Rhodococcus kroppenstedtii]
MTSSVPLPGQHRPAQQGGGADGAPDPDAIRAQVGELLTEADRAAQIPSGEGTADVHGLVALTRRAQILGRAHDVLVDALSSVDKS